MLDSSNNTSLLCIYGPIYVSISNNIYKNKYRSGSEQSATGEGHSCRLIGSAVSWLQLCGVRCTGRCRRVHRQVAVNGGLKAAEQTGAAGADAADSRQVGMMEDGQLHGQTTPHAERNHRK